MEPMTAVGLTQQAPPGSRTRSGSEFETPPDVVDLGGREPAEASTGGFNWKRALAFGGVAAVTLVLAGCGQAEGRVAVSNGLFNEGYADQQGNYYDGIGAKLGRVSESGHVYEFLGPYIGRVDDSGRVWGLLLPVGTVSPDGQVRNGLGLPVGKVQGSDPNRVEQVEKAGAALLLLHE